MGAHASEQSQPIASSEALHAKYEALEVKHKEDTSLEKPELWGGYSL